MEDGDLYIILCPVFCAFKQCTLVSGDRSVREHVVCMDGLIVALCGLTHRKNFFR